MKFICEKTNFSISVSSYNIKNGKHYYDNGLEILHPDTGEPLCPDLGIISISSVNMGTGKDRDGRSKIQKMLKERSNADNRRNKNDRMHKIDKFDQTGETN